MPEQVAVSAGIVPSEDSARNSPSSADASQQIKGLDEIILSVTMTSFVNAALPLFVTVKLNVTRSPTAANDSVGLVFVIARAGIAPVGTVAESLGDVTVPFVPAALLVTEPRATSSDVTE